MERRQVLRVCVCVFLSFGFFFLDFFFGGCAGASSTVMRAFSLWCSCVQTRMLIQKKGGCISSTLGVCSIVSVKGPGGERRKCGGGGGGWGVL